MLFTIAAIWGNRPHVPQRDPQTVHRSAQQLAQGLYLARAADCMACHDSPGGQPFAGGKPLPTPSAPCTAPISARTPTTA
ncbi:hypothetical protein [Delftia tsuruhatensis]|uniref:hypothetical protein n=1 Tax=Delftia tsuruhatensis TaxID=180282 RepID=UPI001E74D761|nr:hypothetical protein [Delftia tsuruhatensis]CAC9682557.1 Gluconate 2-dehydrogenase cytochrome c subunit precursor [Delftia tsuruhatensis]